MSTIVAPAEIEPTTSFAEAMDAPPPMDTAASPGTFTIKFSLNGVEQGYLGQNNNGWAILVDAAAAVQLEWYPWNSQSFICTPDESWWLSVGTTPANNGYVGLYKWANMGNAGWTLENNHLVSAINQQPMSIYSKSNQYIYCWKQYTVLDVTLVT